MRTSVVLQYLGILAIAASCSWAQNNPKPEVRFDPATGIVRVKMLVEDPEGHFLPDIRRENFAVFENGVRQQDAAVDIEHASLSLAVVLEWGGRYQAFNEALYDEVPRAAHQLLAEIEPKDKIAIWTYGDRAATIADFSKPHDALDALFLNLNEPQFSEANLYDAMISTLQRMKTVTGRKALVLISSGIDTFSRASYTDVLAAAGQCGTPVYVINLAPSLRTAVTQSTEIGPYARLDWARAGRELEGIAKTSGGRLYSPDSTFDLSGVYDAMMETLRVRYVVTYKSPNERNLTAARTVRVELIDPATGGALQILNSKGQPVQANSIIQESYLPSGGSSPAESVARAARAAAAKETTKSY
jgi:Ca-activated chloride channel family protein